jgi:cyclopropane fatty-acyl-phospholipid synthase-like methyltransferase
MNTEDLRDLYTFVGHQDLNLCNPVSEESFQHFVEKIEMKKGPLTVLEIGCGKGGILEILLLNFKVTRCVGVDKSKYFDAVVDKTKIEYICRNWVDFEVKFKSDVVVCVGSHQCFGTTFAGSLIKMKPLMEMNGVLIVGHLYWKKAPPQEFADIISPPEDPLLLFSQLQECIKGCGFDCVLHYEVTEKEFENYENSINTSQMKYLANEENPINLRDYVAQRREFWASLNKSTLEYLGFTLLCLKVNDLST